MPQASKLKSLLIHFQTAWSVEILISEKHNKIQSTMPTMSVEKC